MNQPFYHKGLHFSCTQCSRCCRHDPGYVFLSHNDLENLTRALTLSKKEIIKKYCRVIDLNIVSRLSLVEKENYDCIFWEKEKGCIVYEHRPFQCRSYPFWSSNLDSWESWDDVSQSCPGINKGKLHIKEEIDHWLELRLKEGYIQVRNGKPII